MSGTVFSLLPPVAAIGLALLTKEVYLSLLIGFWQAASCFQGQIPSMQWKP